MNNLGIQGVDPEGSDRPLNASDPTPRPPDSGDNPPPQPPPTVGRIVIYHFPPDRTFVNNGLVDAPAVVTAVWSPTCINVKVLADGPHNHWMTSINLGEGPHQWSWPKRV